MDVFEIADRIEIRDLIERYSLAVTCRDWEMMGNCFHVDSSWTAAPPVGLEFTGRDGIRKGICSIVSQGDFLVQMTHSSVITLLSADSATAKVVVNEVARNSQQGTALFLLGVYTDRMAKSDGKWRFTARTFSPLYLDPSPLPGQAFVGHSGL